MTYYFDRETGQRVSKSTWTRSKSHGGTRYCRRSVSPSPIANKRKKKEVVFNGGTRKKSPAKKKKETGKKPVVPKRRRKGGSTGRMMYRLTVAAPFYVRNGPKRNSGYGSAAAMVRTWTHRYPGDDRIEEAVELSRENREHEVIAHKRAWSHDEEPNVEVKKVPYDENLIDTEEETTDLP